MSESSLSLQSRELSPSPKNRISSVSDSQFFEFYSQVSAFNTVLKKPNEAVDLFSSSKVELEDKLKESAGERREDKVAEYHSLLALLHWLYPNHRGYDKQRNASSMFDHAIQATEHSKDTLSESYVVGLFVQLRVLPFLMRSNKSLIKDLDRTREKASALISVIDSGTSGVNQGEIRGPQNLSSGQMEGLRGILLEGVGFSYWQADRNVNAALGYLQKSVESLIEVDRSLSNNRSLRFQTSAKTQKNRKVSPNPIRDFYSAMISVAYWDLGLCYEGRADTIEGAEMIRQIKKARADFERSYSFAKRTTWDNYKGLSAYMIAGTYETETQIETDKEKIRQSLKRTIMIADEALRWLSLWSTYDSDFLAGSWIAGCYSKLADYSSPRLREKYMLRSLKLVKKAEDLINQGESNIGGKLSSAFFIGDIFFRNSDYYRQLANSRKSSLDYPFQSSKKQTKLIVETLRRSLEYALRSRTYYKGDRLSKKPVDACLLAADVCYELLTFDISEPEKRRQSSLGKRMCNEARAISKENGWNESVAESNWLLGQILDLEGKYAKSADSYVDAYEFYEKAKSASDLGINVYDDFADYMLAWNKIELAKIAHVSSDFEKAATLYSEAADLISHTREWSRGSGLFLAESLIERGEGRSLEEDRLDEAVESFVQAISNLSKFCEEAKKDPSPYMSAFLTLAQQLTIFCQARIILEKSKEAYRIGDIESSVSGLSEAETMFEDLASNRVISDPLRSNELQSMASLCRALSRFQRAQLKNNPKLYLDAMEIFRLASEVSRSKTLRPLLAGLASFAAFLYHSNRVESSLDTKLDADLVEECNKALQSAETNFKKVGNKSFLNILKASKHILDATIKMSSAEREIENAQVKAKLYAEAQRSLSLASKHYKLVGSSPRSLRVKEALKMISAVRNHQRLIPLAHDIIAEVASNQIIYAAIASSSVIEQTPHSSTRGLGTSYISFDSQVAKPYTEVGEISKVILSVSNLGREPITVVKIDEVVPEGFEIVECPVGLVEGHSIKLERRIDARSSKSLIVSCKPMESGEFTWHPALIYLDPSKNFRLAKSHIARSIVEQSKTRDFASLLKIKSSLESEMEALKLKIAQQDDAGKQNLAESIYTIREKISKIEEEFLRTKNEYVSMTSELERIRADIESLDHRNSSNMAKIEESADLKTEEKLLQARIERRRLLLDQVRLL